MKSLMYLSLMKIKGSIRNQFRTLTSAVVTILLILIYGGLFVEVFLLSSSYDPESMQLSANTAILAGIGMLGLMSFSVMMNKRKALVFDTDAYYLFAGPYSRRQINGFILMQTVRQSLLYGFVGSFMTAMLSLGGYFSVSYFLVSFVVYAMLFSVFLLLSDYFYMWSLVDEKYKKGNYIVPVLILAAVGVVFFLSVKRSGYELKDGAMNFAMSRDFYYVPFFGWAKSILNAFIEKEYLSMLPGFLLLLLCNAVLAALFLGFKENIAEQAVRDAEAVSEYVRQTKANGGFAKAERKNIKKIKGEFPEGARAIFFKNFLIMRKSGNFLRKQDIFIIVFYFVISYLSAPAGGRFYMFSYMMIIWLFTLLNDADLLGDLKNYQIYLIPEHPLKKLVYTILPAYVKIAIVIGASVIFAGVFDRMKPLAVLQYLVTLLGYGMIFIAGTVLSVRLLKSRSNVMLENLLRMLIVVAAAIPSVIAGVLVFAFVQDLNTLMSVVSVTTLIMNFVVSALIIAACQGMMKGKEL